MPAPALTLLNLTTTADADKSVPVRAAPAEPSSDRAFDPRDYPQLRRALMRAVGRASPAWMKEHCEDVVQVAMTKVIAAMDQGKPAEEIRLSYIARVAYNAVVDEMRRQHRRRTLRTVDLDTVSEPVDESGSTPEAHVVTARLGDEVRDCLGNIARSRRLAVALYLEGRGATEIASMFDWKRKQADNLVYRGLGDLRRCLTSKGIEP